ncbi:MAG: elongation factor G-like protein EF-G2 [Actinomycetales bacterium]
MSTSQVRNIVVVGHTGAGKTSLIEALLHGTGAIPRPGTVNEGTTVSDHADIEHQLGRSVHLSTAYTVVDHPQMEGTSVRLAFLDTPGHPDFVGELRAGLRAADAALFVVSAVDGVDGATRLAWQECAAVQMPRMVVITQLDRPRANYLDAVATCAEAFGEGVQPIYIPVTGSDGLSEGEPTGVLGLLSWTLYDESGGLLTMAPASSDLVDRYLPTRNTLVEGIIAESEDDDLLERYLGGLRVPFSQLVADLESAVARGTFYPVVPAIPISGLGVREIVEVLVQALPTPGEHPVPIVTTPEGEAREQITASADGPLLAEVVKTSTDPYVGRASLVRIFSGRLRATDNVHVSGHAERFADADLSEPEADEEGHDLDERAASISLAQGSKLTPIDEAVAGDIVVVTKLMHAETGDTLSSPSEPLLLQPWVLPEPLLPTAISAPSSAVEDKLAHALKRIHAEDPTARVVVDPQTRQQVLWTMGESHLQVLLDAIARHSGVEPVTSPVRVALRETVKGSAPGHGRHVKQSGGHGQYAIVDVIVEPLEQGAGFEFVDEVTGGDVPRQFIPSVEKGVRAQLAQGVHGNPMVDIRVRLIGGKAHSVDSSDAAFQSAGALALVEAATKAGIVLLEPVDDIEVEVDDEYMGSVISDLSSRRGQVSGGTSADDGTSGRTTIAASVPAFELTRYAVDLRSLAHGTGNFTRRYSHHSAVPANVEAKLVEQ